MSGSKHRAYIGKSEAQANSEALMRRSMPFADTARQSVANAWDWRKRQPQDLREAVRMVRRAYADEVPPKLHEGYDSIGEGGTPKMTARAEGYLFGSAQADDAPRATCVGCPSQQVPMTDGDNATRTIDVRVTEHHKDCPAHPQNRPLISYYHTPFRALLATWAKGHDSEPRDEAGKRTFPCPHGRHRRAAIVSHVAIGSMGPREAAIAEDVPVWCAKTVAEDALRSFLASLTDIKVHATRHIAEDGTAA